MNVTWNYIQNIDFKPLQIKVATYLEEDFAWEITFSSKTIFISKMRHQWFSACIFCFTVTNNQTNKISIIVTIEKIWRQVSIILSVNYASMISKNLTKHYGTSTGKKLWHLGYSASRKICLSNLFAYCHHILINPQFVSFC